ncbi:MAG: HAMP domain-containing sensor histidine kinase, partial [Tumebacillaceae bacterium]
KMKQIETLAAGLQEISKGHLDYRVPEQSRDEIGSLASDINRMASELQLTIEEERLAEKTKNELITNVSHDLRTPLTSIMGYLKLLQDKKYDTPAQLDEFIQIASGKSEQLRALIEDLFEYTKLTNQGIRLHRRNIGLNELLEQLTEEFVPVAEEQNVQIVRLIPDDKVLIHADADKMVRVFENLLANAIKYSTKPGEIKVELHPEAEHVVVSVHNQGEPIPPDELPRLFERFYKMETARTSAAGGSGLGLAIAKSIVDLHNGEIWAESTGDEIRFLVRLQRVY